MPVEKWKKRASDLSARHGTPNPLADYRTADLLAMTQEQREALFKDLPPEHNPSIKLRSNRVSSSELMAETVAARMAAEGASDPEPFKRIALELVATLKGQAEAEAMTLALGRYCEATGTKPEDYDVAGIAAELLERKSELAALSPEERQAVLDAVFQAHRATPQVEEGRLDSLIAS